MNTWNWLLHFLIIFDLVAFGIYFGGDILFTAISKVQKKSKKDDDLDLYDFEIETAPQKRSLCVDSIRMLYSGEIDEFVEKELLPDAAETMNALSEAEKTAVSLLLKAYIGFLSEEATVDEQSFPMVKELLSYTQGSKEDGEKDAIDCLMEDTVSRTHRHREYYNNYQRYQLMQVDKERVIMACNIIINDLIFYIRNVIYNTIYYTSINITYICIIFITVYFQWFNIFPIILRENILNIKFTIRNSF